MTRTLLAAISCMLWACAASPPPMAAKPAAPTAAPSRVDALAPDFAARVRGAQRDAALAKTPAARADHERRAMYLALAARAEADRIAFERSFESDSLRIAAAVRERARAERANAAAARDQQLWAAAERERAEASWAFGVLASARREPNERERLSAFLLRRAQALVAASLALTQNDRDGSIKALADAAALQLTAAGSAGLSSRVAASQQALLAATRALGAARLAAGPVRPAQTRDLIERLAERGFRAQDAGAPDHATAIVVDAAFDPTARDPRPDMQRKLQSLIDLLPGFPHGSIAIACGGEGRLALERNERLQASFARIVDRSRLTTLSAPIAAHALRVVWTAYASEPQGPLPAP